MSSINLNDTFWEENLTERIQQLTSVEGESEQQ